MDYSCIGNQTRQKWLNYFWLCCHSCLSMSRHLEIFWMKIAPFYRGQKIIPLIQFREISWLDHPIGGQVESSHMNYPVHSQLRIQPWCYQLSEILITRPVSSGFREVDSWLMSLYLRVELDVSLIWVSSIPHLCINFICKNSSLLQELAW